MITLAIDASTYAGSVAVIRDGDVLSERTTAMKGADEERLMPAVAEALAGAKVDRSAIDRIVCGEGPGSFTSLRIAGSIAKGIAAGLGCPLYAAPSLALIVAGGELPAGSYLAAVDALRGQYYVARYKRGADGEVEEIDAATLIAADALESAASGSAAKLVGPAHGGVQPRARGVIRLARLLAARGRVNLASWEPVYGRLAEAQVRWESAHGRPLPSA
jgi:tRNA threonylcarbamoyladenosine biosynthesis protein TsaB